MRLFYISNAAGGENMSFKLGKEFELENFTGTIEVKDRGWYLRLRNLFKPQKTLLKFTKKN